MKPPFPLDVVDTIFFLSFHLLIGWQLFIWNCCKPLFSLLYNCQLLCFCWVALSIVVGLFSRYCSFRDVYYKLVMPNCMPYPWVVSIFFFFNFKSNFFLLPFEKLHHLLFCLSILYLTFFSSTMFQMHLWPFLHFFLGSMFLMHKEQHSKYNFL